MIENTTWPEASRELAESLLSNELKRLLMKLDIYMLLIPYEPDQRVPYTVELSDIFHDVGRCGIIAEVAGSIYINNCVNNVGDLLTDLLNHIDYDNTRDKLIGMTRTLRDIIQSLNTSPLGGSVSMKEYKEHTR
jgi:hypothetical protein